MVRSARRIASATAVVAALALSGVIVVTTNFASRSATETGASGSPSALATVVDVKPTRVVLTPTATPSTSQSFSWSAGDASHVTGQLQIRADGGDVRPVDAHGTGRVNDNPHNHFSATVTELIPSTTYRYRVGIEGSWSGWWKFTTASSDSADFQFIYYGDAQSGLDSTWPAVVRQAESSAPGAIGSVHAGDLVNGPGNEDEWLAWFEGMGDSAAERNVLAAPGNHEYISDPLLRAWKVAFENPRNGPKVPTDGDLGAMGRGDSDVARQYAAYFAHWAHVAAETVYYTDYQNVRFIALNATQDEVFLAPASLPSCVDDRCPSGFVGELWVQFQADWLDRVLTESDSKWNVVTFHQPVYSASSGRDEPVLREHWVPVLEAHNVDLVLMGHDHVYARGYNDADRTDVEAVTDGPVYVVSNSGAKHYELAGPNESVWTANNATQVRAASGVTTYQVIDVSPDQLVYRSYLAEVAPESASRGEIGGVFDEFTISKTDEGRKRVSEGHVTASPK